MYLNLSNKLLFVNKLVSHDNRRVQFYPRGCMIQDMNTDKVLGIGRALNGPYDLMNEPMNQIVKILKKDKYLKDDKKGKSEMLLIMHPTRWELLMWSAVQKRKRKKQ